MRLFLNELIGLDVNDAIIKYEAQDLLPNMIYDIIPLNCGFTNEFKPNRVRFIVDENNKVLKVIPG